MEGLSIIKAKINGAEVNTIDARLLYSKLNVQSKFADWIKNRLQDFQENIDFIVSKNLETVNTGLKSKVDYILSLETAKHIAMIERNAEGKKIRDYFINFEKEAKQKLSTQPQLPQEQQIVLLAQQVLKYNEEKKQLTQTVQKQEKAISIISNTQGLYSWRELAKKISPFGISETELREALINKDIIYKLKDKYVPTSKAIKQGLAQYKTEIVEFKHKEAQSFENIYYTNKLCECLLKSIQNKIQKEGVSQTYYIEQKQSTELRSRGL
jgi:anti-repressor protein